MDNAPEIPGEGVGYLKIRVSTAGDVIPVEGAVVYIRSLGAGEDDRLMFSLRTDEDGATRTAALPAPTVPAEGAAPDEEPVRIYGVEIKKDGYRPLEYAGVPIYAGITSLIEAELLPESEDENYSDFPPRAELVPSSPRPGLFGGERG
ncbi:MAG: hypothetical protein IJS78_03285 [Clostridia bacterium]|nr:hypothetical protein [Clostridia bacterium]